MNPTLKAVVEACTRDSDRESASFPQIVGRLMEAGVERYHTDLVRAEKTYYLPGGETHVVPADPLATKPPSAFVASAVDAAVRAIQQGKLTYKAFCERIAEAGCVGYHVSLAGRRAVYYGRTGETHVEPFPAAR